MRLLDRLAQCSAPFVVRQADGALWQLPGPSDFAPRLRRCPLRYVLADDLVQTCTELAYSGGDELSSCLDLIHLPAQELWVEWDERIRQRVLTEMVPEVRCGDLSDIRRAGVLIRGGARGRSGTLRTFWLGADESSEVMFSPIETLLDLDGAPALQKTALLLAGQTVRVCEPGCPELDAILQCAGFRLDEPWLRYYRATVLDRATQDEVVRELLSAVAFDVAMLTALFLLMALRVDLGNRMVDTSRLNMKRSRIGKPALLEHIEVCASVFAGAGSRCGTPADSTRRGPRFHHVRGHIVRRHDTVYWRAPHWRGHIRMGHIRTRTVQLQLPA